jgi:hypothetical protein
MNLNITYDSSTLSTAPATFFTAVNYVANLYDTTFTNNVTVNIEVGYGDLPSDNSVVPPLGESNFYYDYGLSYPHVRQILLNENAPGSSTLPSTAPIGGNLTINTAEEKALGLIGVSTALDGSVSIASNATLETLGDSWSFSPAATPASNQYYIVGTLEHEISEVMGRVSELNLPNEYSVMDLYRYEAAGVRQTGTGDPSYFSIDGGQTNLDSWNNAQIKSGDLGDWAPHAGPSGILKYAGPDAYLNNSLPGQINGLSQTDLTLMAALGWNVAPAVKVENVNVAENAAIPASALITSVTNPSNISITQYAFWDAGTGNGHLTLNGAAQSDGQWITVSASALGAIQYDGGASLGTETLNVAVYDATAGTWSQSSSLTATTTATTTTASSGGLLNTLSLTEQIELIYTGYFDRSADGGGFVFWEGQDASAQAGGQGAALALTNIANSFTPQAETIAIYPFLSNPNPNFSSPTVQAGLDTFIENAYGNLFGHAADSGGLTYWLGQIESGVVGLGAAVLAIANGATGSDAIIVQNKVAVALDFTNQTSLANLPTDATFIAEAKAVLAGVDGLFLNDASVVAAEALIGPWITSHPSGASVALIGSVSSVSQALLG